MRLGGPDFKSQVHSSKKCGKFTMSHARPPDLAEDQSFRRLRHNFLVQPFNGWFLSAEQRARKNKCLRRYEEIEGTQDPEGYLLAMAESGSLTTGDFM